MKQLAYSILLAALLAGCAGTSSKDAAIEDRGIKVEPAEPAKIVDAGSGVETKAVAGTAPISESASKASDTVRTSGSSSQPVTVKSSEAAKTSGAATQSVTAKSAEGVETRAVVASNSEVKPLAEGQSGAPTGAGAAQPGAEGKAAQDTSTLPYSGGMPSWGDLKNPESPLFKRRVLFDYDSAAIRDEYRPVLEAHAAFMKSNKEAKAILQGNTDERGSREYNLALGQRRAESVFKAMNLLGVPERAIRPGELLRKPAGAYRGLITRAR